MAAFFDSSRHQLPRSMQQHTVLIVGGAGFLGSAISKAAVSRGWRVLSISPSGTPFTTPAGHRPAWSSSPNIEWHAADALDPASYKHLTDRSTAAVHTVGILLESDYKSKQPQSGGALRNTLAGLAKGWGFRLPGPDDRGNPLQQQSSTQKPSKMSYETMNRDSAVSVAHTFLRSLSERPNTSSAPFIYISAEDLFRPVVDARYISTKRQAEAMIAKLAMHASSQPSSRPVASSADQEELDADGAGLTGELRNESLQERMHKVQSTLRPVFMRPGLMYHPHTRPGSTLPAAILEASAAFHRTPPLPLPIPTPAEMLARWGGSSMQSMSKLMTTPPLHIDTVAKAVCAAIEDSSVQGPVDVTGIRKLAGWKDDSPSPPAPSQTRPFSTQTFQASSARPVGITAMPSQRGISTRQIPSARRTFFNQADLSRFVSSKISPRPSKTQSDEVDGHSYTDADGNTVYEARKVLPYSPQFLFGVVADINSYKHFVPYCKDSRTLAEPPPPAANIVFADLTVGYGTFHETYRSKVTAFQPAEDSAGQASRVVAEAVQPNPIFSRLVTEWRFQPVESVDETLLQFSISYAFRSPLYGAVAGGVFQKMSSKIMVAFEERADIVAREK